MDTYNVRNSTYGVHLASPDSMSQINGFYLKILWIPSTIPWIPYGLMWGAYFWSPKPSLYAVSSKRLKYGAFGRHQGDLE